VPCAVVTPHTGMVQHSRQRSNYAMRKLGLHAASNANVLLLMLCLHVPVLLALLIAVVQQIT